MSEKSALDEMFEAVSYVGGKRPDPEAADPDEDEADDD